MPTTPYAWDAHYDFKPVWRFKPADRLAELEHQLSYAAGETVAEDTWTGGLPIVEVMYVVSKFDTTPTYRQFVSHGLSTAIDGNGKDAFVGSDPGDPDVKLMTIGQHLIGAINPVTEP